MSLNTIEFLAFLLIGAVLYFLIPRRGKRVLLLILSVLFYLTWNIPNTALLLVSALLTYALGILCGKSRRADSGEHASGRGGRFFLILGLILLLGELFFFKYLNFTVREANTLIASLGGGFRLPAPVSGIIVPLGVSFFVFQSIGYLVDVYRGKAEPEKNVINFLLFITFFPKIIQGPIERSDGFLKQIRTLEEDSRGKFDYQRVSGAMITFLWGMFLKMVISDRIAIVADRVFGAYYLYGTVELALAAVCYAIQIYCDFAGYSAMAVGAAGIFGFELTENFDCPYFSASTREFWRRWHISLSSWFRDYVYIPLGGSRCSRWRKWLNVMIVMLVSGIWHGTGWNFLVWGLIHGFYQVMSDALTPAREKLFRACRARTDSVSHLIGKMLVTFVLIDLAWIFFRAESIAVAIDYISRMFTRFDPWVLFDGSLLALGLDQIEVNILFFALLILLIVDLVQYRYKLRISKMLENQSLWFRWGVIILLFTMVWVVGKYGPSFSSTSFIYQSF